jgi:radial spoke head protein 4A
MWQWAGIGFGEQETYRLQKSMKGLSEKCQAQTLRFFGKIWGTQKDYYVVEATGAGGGEEGEEGGGEGEPEAGMEAPGTGVNKFTYFVTHSTLSDWIKLPDLSPKDIVATR